MEHPLPDHGTKMISKTSVADGFFLISKLVEAYPNFVRNISDFQYEHPIGRGGFGEVWLANDLRTGKQCAIKELHSRKFNGKTITAFAREINSMIMCPERCILKLIGFTADPPFSIITEYIPNGCLYQYVNKAKRKTSMDGTRLTETATGIVWGLMALHRLRIVHRDIKSQNILLDQENNPVICDFGTSRFESKNRRMSIRIGTMTHMAPEVMFTDEYSTSADIWSLGVLLYEMSEGRLPFRGHPDAIMNMMKDPKKPIFDANSTVPDCMRTMIEKCLDPDPAKRPTAVDIFEEFRKGQLFFSDTNMQKYRKFLVHFLKTERNLWKERKKAGNVPPKPTKYVDTESTLERLTRQYRIASEVEARGEVYNPVSDDGVEEEEEANENELEDVPDVKVSPIEALSSSNNPLFWPTMNYMVEHLTLKQFNTFYKLIFPYFKEGKDTDVLIEILDMFSKMIQRENKFIDSFIKARFITVLPLSTLNASKKSLDFVAAACIGNWKRMSGSMFRVLGSALLKIPASAIKFFERFAVNFSNVKDPFSVLDLLLSYASVFYERPCGADFVSVIVYLVKNYSEVKQMRLNKVIPILNFFCRSVCRAVAVAAVKAMIILWEGSPVISYQAMSRNLRDSQLSIPSLSLLKRVDIIPASRTLCDILIERLPASNLVLLKFASCSDAHETILMNNLKWMSRPDCEIFRLFMFLFRKRENRPVLANSPLFSPFMASCAGINDTQILIALPSLLKRAELNQELIDVLTKSLFFKQYLISVSKSNSSQVKFVCSTMLDSTARIGFSPDYSLYLPMIGELLSLRNELTQAAITVLVTLSSHKEIAAQLADTSFVMYFTSLQKVPSQQKAAARFLHNIKNAL